MNLLATAGGYLLSALFIGGWICLTIEYFRAAITGRFWFWRRTASGNSWPPVRSEKPVQFWLVWAAMAGPFLFITTLVLFGLGITQLQGS